MIWSLVLALLLSQPAVMPGAGARLLRVEVYEYQGRKVAISESTDRPQPEKQR